MDRDEAARILGILPDATWPDVRRAYRRLIRARHPDQAGIAATADAMVIIEAYGVLRSVHAPSAREARPGAGTTATATRVRATERPVVPVPPTAIVRLDDDTIAFGAPPDETFALLLEAAHDLGELTYVDRSMPILEVICQFVGTPTLSLVITLQGRCNSTEAFCTVESIEARPGPPTRGVVDVLLDLLQQRT